MAVKIAKKRIILTVINDLVTDQRVHRVATTLAAHHHVKLVGRKLRHSKDIHRDYQTHRFRLLINKGPLFYFCFNIRLFFYLLIKPFDVVVANDLDTLLACFMAAKLKGKQLIYDSHEFFTEVPELVNRPHTQGIWQHLEKILLPKIKYASTVCQSIAEAYHEKYGIRMEVIRNVPFYKDCPGPTQRDLHETPVLIYQGSLNMGRGIENLIDAMVYLEEFLLLIVGTGDIADKLYQQAKQKHLLNRIEFTGKLPFEELHQQTCKAHLGIALEENIGLNYYYALPNKLFDYVQARIPVLASPFPEMQRIIHQYDIGIVHDFTSAQKLAAQIQEIFQYPKRYMKWQIQTHEAARELCWEKEQNKLIALYRAAGIPFPEEKGISGYHTLATGTI